MAFPAFATPPTLARWQMSYRGVAFGGIAAGSTYQLQQLTGLDLPATIAGDVQRALDQGEFIGLDTLPGRDITITQVARATTDAALDAARQILAGVLGVTGTTEAPLYLQLASGIYACMARPRKHDFPVDINTVLAKGTPVNTMLHATDPRWYAVPTKVASVGLPGPLGGLTFPVTFPASFGGGGSVGLLQVTNAGLFEMRPRLIFTGPCTNPSAQNLSIAGAPTLAFNITLATGDQLVVDTDFQSIVLITSGSTVGSSRRSALTAGSTWWNLPPGLNQIAFGTSDVSFVAGTLTVQSADAWIGL